MPVTKKNSGTKTTAAKAAPKKKTHVQTKGTVTPHTPPVAKAGKKPATTKPRNKSSAQKRGGPDGHEAAAASKRQSGGHAATTRKSTVAAAKTTGLQKPGLKMSPRGKDTTPASTPESATAPKKRLKGVDKHYVAPPTAVRVQNTAKLHHLPPAANVALNPAVIPAAVRKNPKLANNWKSKDPTLLTDAEVISMPDSEYMNEVQLAFFRHRLIELQNSILHNASDTTDHMRDDTLVVPDPTDRATIEEEHALELRTRDRERKLLKKIELSIARIDHGEYGYCEETGEPIGVSRLIARPTASLSLEAQQRREMKQRMFGG